MATYLLMHYANNVLFICVTLVSPMLTWFQFPTAICCRPPCHFERSASGLTPRPECRPVKNPQRTMSDRIVWYSNTENLFTNFLQSADAILGETHNALRISHYAAAC